MTTENQNTQSKAADKALSDPTCSRCGGIHANDCDSFWDDGKGGKLCQMCWEAVADEEWRDRVRAMVITKD